MNKFCGILVIVILSIVNIYSGHCNSCKGGKKVNNNSKTKTLSKLRNLPNNRMDLSPKLMNDKYDELDIKNKKNKKGNEDNNKKRKIHVVELTISNDKIVFHGMICPVVKINTPKLTDDSFNCIYYKMDEESFDVIKKDVNFRLNSISENIDIQKETPYMIVAVLCDDNKYYIIYCNDADSQLEKGFFDKGVIGNKVIKAVKIISNGGITKCDNMFYGCNNLEWVDFSNFKTETVTNMEGMFNECSKLVSLNLHSFNTELVTDMNAMFYKCKELKELILSDNFKTNDVIDMSNMFKGCGSLEKLNLASFNTEKVEDFESMFADCPKLSNIKLSDNFKPTNVDKEVEDTLRLFGDAGIPKGLKTNINLKSKGFIIDPEE